MKWLLWILAGFAGILMLITVIGWLLPKQHTLTREARFRQPPDVIWKTITDIEAMPNWREGLKSVKRRPDHNGLPSWSETRDSGTIPFETEISQAPTKLIVRIADPQLPFGGTWRYEITSAPDGSKLRITENGEVYNPIFRFLSRFVFGHSTTMEAYLRSMAKKFGEPPQIGE